MMGSVSDQFRNHVGLEGDPDPALGLENAKGKKGGEPVEVDDVLHPAPPEDAKSGRTGDTETAKRTASKKAEHKETREKSKPSAKKAAAKKSTAKKK
jgi:hypothetical protein